MKKVLITMAMLTSMVAGAMVFSSFATPKTNDEPVCSQINANDDEWTRIGEYYGYDNEGNKSRYTFLIWERKNACNSYYWVYKSCVDDGWRPDTTNCPSGVLRQNSEKKWYAALGTNYFIDF